MISYVKLKLKKLCGHTEFVIFDINDDFENKYNKQSSIYCIDCLLKNQSCIEQSDEESDEAASEQMPVQIPEHLKASEVKSLKTMDLATKRFIYADMEQDIDKLKTLTFSQITQMPVDKQRMVLIRLRAEYVLLLDMARALQISYPVLSHLMISRQITKKDIIDYKENIAKNDPDIITWAEFKYKATPLKYDILLKLLTKYNMSMVAKLMHTYQSTISRMCSKLGITAETIHVYKQKTELKS